VPPFCTPTTMKSGSRCASRAARDVLGSQPWYSAPAALLLATKVKGGNAGGEDGGGGELSNSGMGCRRNKTPSFFSENNLNLELS